MRPLRGRAACAAVDLNPQFAGGVAGRDADERVQLLSDPGPDRYAIHSAMRPGFREDALLRPAALMEGNDIARVRRLVGDDDLEFVNASPDSQHPASGTGNVGCQADPMKSARSPSRWDQNRKTPWAWALSRFAGLNTPAITAAGTV